MVICLDRGADLHIAQLMPLPLTVSCFSKIQIGFTFLVPAHLGSPGKMAIKRCVCVCVCVFISHFGTSSATVAPVALGSLGRLVLVKTLIIKLTFFRSLLVESINSAQAI